MRLLLVMALCGCVSFTIDYPRSPDAALHCTDSYVLPIFDSGVALGALGLGALAPGLCEVDSEQCMAGYAVPRLSFAFAAVVAVAATYGYVAVHRCRNAQARDGH